MLVLHTARPSSELPLLLAEGPVAIPVRSLLLAEGPCRSQLALLLASSGTRIELNPEPSFKYSCDKIRCRQTHSSKDTREHNESSKDTREHNGKIENIQQVSSRSSIFILLQQFFGLLQQFFGPNPGPWHGWPGVYIRPCPKPI